MQTPSANTSAFKGIKGWASLALCATLLVGTRSVLPHAAAQAPAGAACDQACLENFVDLYMEAMIAHSLLKVPMSPKIKNTEDGVQLEPGDGFWRTAIYKGSYRLFVTDVETGTVGFMGTMREFPANPVIIMIRLKVVNRQIAEMENMVVRDAAAATRLENRGKPHEVFSAVIPVAQRATRAALINVANMYFSGLERNDGKGNYPFTDDCERVQNGVQTTHNPDAAAQMAPPAPAPGRGAKGGPPPAAAKPAGPTFNVSALGCLDQFKSGYFNFVTRVRDRRMVAVDRERGLVLALASFDQAAGKYRNFKMADGKAMTAGPERQTTLAIAELFKIEGGKIRRVEAIQNTVPYGMITGWSSWEDGMSSKARDMR